MNIFKQRVLPMYTIQHSTDHYVNNDMYIYDNNSDLLQHSTDDCITIVGSHKGIHSSLNFGGSVNTSH